MYATVQCLLLALHDGDQTDHDLILDVQSDNVDSRQHVAV
jgi:hypothetical protein